MAQYFEPLTLAAVGAASKTLSHPQQMALLDQTKTLAESALQLLYTAKEAGGNPKVLRAGLRGCFCSKRSRNSWAPAHSLCPTASSSHPGSPGGGCTDDDRGRGGPDSHPQRGSQCCRGCRRHGGLHHPGHQPGWSLGVPMDRAYCGPGSLSPVAETNNLSPSPFLSP